MLSDNHILKGGALRIIVGITVLALLHVGSAEAATHTVNASGANYTKIQDAIDASNAADIILVYSGTYYENVNVNKPLILQGIDNGGGKPIVDSRGRGIAITLSANGSTLEGFNATRSSGPWPWPNAAIYVSSSNNIIKNNNASNNINGIYLYSSSNNILMANNASSNKKGIYLYSSNNNTLSSNNAYSNHQIGIYLDSSGNNTLISNNVNPNKYYFYGIYLISSNNNNLSGNNVSNNYCGIYLISSNNNNLSSNSASNNINGIYLISSNNNTLIGNNASDSYNGIYLDSSISNILIENIASKNGYGINLSSSISNILIGNNASNNDYGIFLFLSGKVVLINNIMKGNKYNFGLEGNSHSDFDNQIDTTNLVDGKPVYYIKGATDIVYDSYINAGTFYCISCLNVTLKDLDLKSNQNGIFFKWTTDSRIQNITALNNYVGISLDSSRNNTLIRNNASGNINYGISLYLSSDNNTLIRNNASKNGYGIHLSYSSNNKLGSNNANLNNYIGIFLDSSSNNMLSSNKAPNNFYGIYLTSSISNMLIGNNASNNDDGIYLVESSNNTLRSNNANLNNWAGISLDSSGNNMLSSNNASNNYYYGIRISSNNNTLIRNNASNNGYGIRLWYSNNNTLSRNNANSNHYHGISLDSSSNNTLGNNNASNNSYGIYLYSMYSLSTSSNNTIYNNYFSNTKNAFDSGKNIWNIPRISGTNIINGTFSGGNFWSDYTGNDTDGDGLGDTMLPYNSSGGIANGGDYLPLVYVISPVPTAGGSISGFKINDTNANRKWDAGEKSISNWTIRLIGIIGKGKDSKVIRKDTFTDNMGFYKFDNLQAGRYFVIEKLKKGFVPTGSPVKRIKLAQGENTMNNNFTNRPANSRDKIDDQRDVDYYEIYREKNVPYSSRDY